MFWHPRVNSNLMVSHVKLQMITVLFENLLKCSDIHGNHENLFSETSETSQNIVGVKSTSNDISLDVMSLFLSTSLCGFFPFETWWHFPTGLYLVPAILQMLILPSYLILILTETSHGAVPEHKIRLSNIICSLVKLIM